MTSPGMALNKNLTSNFDVKRRVITPYNCIWAKDGFVAASFSLHLMPLLTKERRLKPAVTFLGVLGIEG